MGNLQADICNACNICSSDNGIEDQKEIDTEMNKNQDTKDSKDAPNEAVIPLPTNELDKDTVLFWIERSKNKNIVVYEATKNNNDNYNDINAYWILIEGNDNKEELNFLEKKMAYGIDMVQTENKEPEFEANLVSVPEMKLVLMTDSDGKPHIITTINDKKCYLRKIYVATKESWTGLPDVEYVIITGIQIDNGEIQSKKRVVSNEN